MDAFTELFGTSPLIWAILGAEAAFWILLFGGLAVRYLLRQRRLSTIMLIGVPVVDLVLIALTAIDLAGGQEPNFSHVLAALYLGFTIAFGHALITKTDRWFAHRFAGGPAPVKKPKSGPVYVRNAWAEWRRLVLAWAIAMAGIAIMKAVSGWSFPTSLDEANSDPMWSIASRLTLVVGVWLVAGPLYATFFKATPVDTTHGVSVDAASKK
ncbi:hypothetical protein ACL9RL_16565 [Plantibacter sp. Mn2098]|uniref:hypothetical protein n=1 Tax=Plantibacter sp. Mn2098 TaxID=3395266 RepID=UPI003BCBFAF9